MLTTNELKDALAADAAAPPLNRDRLAQVRGRVTARRRRRTAATVLASVAVFAAAAVVALPRVGSPSTTTPPGAQPSPSATGLPEYQRGGRLIAQAEATGPDGLTISFTPTSKGVFFAIDCYVPGDGPALPLVRGRIGGTLVFESSCSNVAEPSSGNTIAPDDLAALGIVPGERSVLTVAFKQPVPDASRVRTGVYEEVAVESYPFPPAPDPLPSVSPNWQTQYDIDPAARRFLTATPEASDGFSYTVPLRKGLQIEAMTVAPGELRVFADDRLIWESRSWNYADAQAGTGATLADLGIKAGQEVTFRIEAERFPDSTAPVWELRLYDAVTPTGP